MSAPPSWPGCSPPAAGDRIPTSGLRPQRGRASAQRRPFPFVGWPCNTSFDSLPRPDWMVADRRHSTSPLSADGTCHCAGSWQRGGGRFGGRGSLAPPPSDECVPLRLRVARVRVQARAGPKVPKRSEGESASERLRSSERSEEERSPSASSRAAARGSGVGASTRDEFFASCRSSARCCQGSVSQLHTARRA